MSRIVTLFAACGLMLGLTGPLAAQDAPATAPKPAGLDQPAAPFSACSDAAAKAEPATAQTASQDGTAPDNSGSTGWTGGTGGSHIGTNPSGAGPATATWHAPTARGLDLKGRPEAAPAC